MKKQTVVFLKTFLITGIIYSALMAGSDYREGLSFDLWKALYNFIFFGLLMGSLNLFLYKKQLKKSKKEKDET